MVLCFALGVVAVGMRSDLRVPEGVHAFLSIYLLLAIGFRGGIELAATSPATIWRPALATLALGIVTPVAAYAVLRRCGRFDIANAAALAAHYGSVSVVTFGAAITFLDALNVAVEPFLATLVVLLEIPAIMVALGIARWRLGGAGSWRTILHELLAGRSTVLLVGGLVIGVLAGHDGAERMAPFFVDIFPGMVALFLMEMGMTAAARLRDVRRSGLFLVAFAMAMPLANGALGVLLGHAAGLSVGGTAVLGVLAASASYIAAPAAVRAALPQANPSIYLTASLAITFPFNLVAGIPLYYGLSRLLHGA